MLKLAERGNGQRESGAFLIGTKDKAGRRQVMSFLLYDDLEPGCLDCGFVKMSSVGFRALAAELKAGVLEVVADIHTHPGPAFFSQTDCENPMVPIKGHLALVVPNYAQRDNAPHECAFFRFLGGSHWEELPTNGRSTKLYVGRWS